MTFISLCRYAIWKFFEIVFSKKNFYALINTRAGVKNINVDRLYSDSITSNNLNDIILIAPSELYLGTDFLKDKYSLIDSCITESPHYTFIKDLNEGRDIKKTEYYQRFVSGKLDERHCQWGRKVSYFIDKNEKAKQSIEKGDYKPVAVYSWKGRYYIYDGKHRAAFCALMNKNVRCMVISPILDFSHSAINKEIYRIMAEDKHYTKHIEFYSDGKK